MVDDLYMLPTHDLVALYRARKVSPVEVCAAVFSRIEQINPAQGILFQSDTMWPYFERLRQIGRASCRERV